MLDYRAAVLLTACLALPHAIRGDEPAKPPAAPAPLTVRHTAMIITAVFSPDGKTLATGGWDNLVRLWDPATGKEVGQLKGQQGAVYHIAFAPDGKTLAASGADKLIRLWDLASGKEVRQFAGHTDGVNKCVFTPNGKTLVSGGYDKTIRVWDVATGKEVRTLAEHQNTVYGLAVSPDGRLIASGSSDLTLRLWDLASGKPVRRCGQNVLVGAVAFAPDGRSLAASGHDGHLYLWEVISGQLRRRFDGNGGSLWGVAYSPDGRVLASGSSGRAVRLWDVATGAQLHQFEQHSKGVPGVAFAPDGKRLATGSHDATGFIYDLAGLIPEPKPKPVHLSAAQRQRLWAELAEADTRQAFEAILALAADPTLTVPFFEEHWQPNKLPDRRRLAQLIADLDSEEFPVRQQATEELEKLGESAETALRQALVNKPSLEVRRRVEGLLARLEGTGGSPQRLRTVRMLEVLERAATPEARRLLEKLAANDDAELAQDARATLERLARRDAKR
jgi:dipeptidyl aminopeptidase/acylaminoacyl peptidase